MPSGPEVSRHENEEPPRRESELTRWDGVTASAGGLVVFVVVLSILKPSLAVPLIIVVVLAALVLVASIGAVKVLGVLGRRTVVGRRVSAYFAPPPAPRTDEPPARSPAREHASPESHEGGGGDA